MRGHRYIVILLLLLFLPLLIVPLDLSLTLYVQVHFCGSRLSTLSQLPQPDSFPGLGDRCDGDPRGGVRIRKHRYHVRVGQRGERVDRQRQLLW